MSIKEQFANSYLDGANASYLEQEYENYLKSPQNTDPKWRQLFDSFPVVDASQPESIHSNIRNQFRDITPFRGSANEGSANQTASASDIEAYKLLQSYRRLGHLKADIDPLKLRKAPEIPFFTASSSTKPVNSANIGFHSSGSLTVSNLQKALEKQYCGHIGYEYMHISSQQELDWFQQKIEKTTQVVIDETTQKRLLSYLISGENFEKYLHNKYVGQKRFSLEGGTALIPLLDLLVNEAAKGEVEEVVMNMAHRGRLNVLVNILGKPPKELFDEFEGKSNKISGSSDVKYHMGYSSDMKTEKGSVHLSMMYNPSHLEIVAPVAQGSCRARQDKKNDPLGEKVLPITMHGDAAFCGQGVVMETFNLSQTRGYSTGGTIHIVINNQIGFTTSHPDDIRSGEYCTDIAKMIEAPILHVNGDKPDAIAQAAKLALEYRTKFHKDIVIDLVCYRRHGHNEADEPMATQPKMYQIIKAHPRGSEIYAKQLEGAKVVTKAEVEQIEKDYREKLEHGESLIDHDETKKEKSEHWQTYLKQTWSVENDTTVKKDIYEKLSKKITEIPEKFNVHSRIKKMLDDRTKMSQNTLPIDWGYAETMAYATLLSEGYDIRITGQDSGRGTFFHRHAVLHNQQAGDNFVPLKHLQKNQGKFTVIDSTLSEEAVLGFEHGYAGSHADGLTIWEAQFGDFCNGAQVIIDQFLASSEQKWGRLSGVTLFLPHGYEGQGPEHSSARLERFLQLCAQENMQVCYPTTPAQCFHMLRRQVIRPYRKPLIVMTPKSLLRHKLAVSKPQDLYEGQFHCVIDEIDEIQAEKVEKVILTTGKIYYELLEARRQDELNNRAIVRIEQLYPFPEQDLKETLKKYPNAKQVIWCQEEPKNQGAWLTIQENINNCLQGSPVKYVGRPASASPAVGYFKKHVVEQAQIIKEALQQTTENH